MQTKTIELQQRAAALNDELNAMLDVAEKEDRGLNEEERKTYDEKLKEYESLQARIGDLQKAEARKASEAKVVIPGPAAGGGEEKEKKKVQRDYRFTRAIRSLLPNQKLEGLELEMHQEATKEMREFGQSPNGIAVPGFMLEAEGQQRDLTVGTSTQIGHTVATDLGGLIPFLRPRLMVQQMGATVLSGLTSNLDIPRNDAVGSATWEGETDANAETNPTVDKLQLTPNRLGCMTDVSKQLLIQSSIGVENFVRNDLTLAVQTEIDRAAIEGSGSGNEPTGILNTSGIGDVAGGTNGAAPTWDHIVELETDLATANADMGTLGYLTTPGVRGKLKTTKIDAGSGIFVWGQSDTVLNGYTARVSTQVPADLTKGTGTALHAIIFGNWRELLIANWGGLDLVVDPYTQAANASIRIIINSWWDLALRHAASFSAMKDADIS